MNGREIMSSISTASREGDPCFPRRATYVNLYKWPESDAEFVRSVATNNSRRQEEGPLRPHVKVVDSYSCRQMYLKSYTFTKKQSAQEKAKNYMTKMKDRISCKVGDRAARGGGCRGVGGKWLKVVSCSALFSALRRLLSCTSGVDVVERRRL